MKTLLMLIALSMLSISVKAQNPNEKMSLNGIAMDDAKNMIKTYQDYISTPGNTFFLKQQSVFFDAATFKSMFLYIDTLNLFRKAHQLPIVDGVRLYFGLTGNPAGKFTFNLIMVPTTLYDTCSSCTSKELHEDLYLGPGAPLFKLPNIQGKDVLQGTLNDGARLYKDDGNGQYDAPCTVTNSDPHYIIKDKALRWVANVGGATMVTKSEWFDLGLLEAFAYDPVHSGIRIYIAKHDSTDTDSYHNQDVANKDIFIFEATKNNGGSEKDYFDCSITTAYFNIYKRNKINFGPTNPGGEDNGELCPDNCKP